VDQEGIDLNRKEIDEVFDKLEIEKYKTYKNPNVKNKNFSFENIGKPLKKGQRVIISTNLEF
jgi:hypothetical protein